MTFRALRGATTIESDTEIQVYEKTEALLTELIKVNSLDAGDVVSIIFTATDDVTSAFPASVCGRMGLGHVPRICARELSITGGMPLCIRILMHVETPLGPDELHHVYLEGASSLRGDLPS